MGQVFRECRGDIAQTTGFRQGGKFGADETNLERFYYSSTCRVRAAVSDILAPAAGFAAGEEQQ
jgi:hypothetical protein